MDLKENVIARACQWRELQRERQAAPHGIEKERAKNAEYFAEKKLGNAVDQLIKSGATVVVVTPEKEN